MCWYIVVVGYNVLKSEFTSSMKQLLCHPKELETTGLTRVTHRFDINRSLECGHLSHTHHENCPHLSRIIHRQSPSSSVGSPANIYGPFSVNKRNTAPPNDDENNASFSSVECLFGSECYYMWHEGGNAVRRKEITNQTAFPSNGPTQDYGFSADFPTPPSLLILYSIIATVGENVMLFATSRSLCQILSVGRGWGF